MLLFKHPIFILLTTILLLEKQVLPFSQLGYPTCSCNRIIKKSHSFREEKITSPLITLSREDAHSGSSHQYHHSSSTSLSMGIRSFLRRGKGGGNNDNNNNNNEEESENPEDVKAALEAIKADLEAVTQKEKEEKAQRMKNIQSRKVLPTNKNLTKKVGEVGKSTNVTASVVAATTPSPSQQQQQQQQQQPESKKSRVKKAFSEMKKITAPSQPSSSSSRYGETVRDRVKRVKSGAMTEDEKLAFLNNALTPRTAPGKKGPRIRQAIPEPGDGLRKSSSNSSKSSKSSSFRNDALWNRVLGNTNPKDRGNGRSPYNIEDVVGSDSAKRKYLDMVTDPNRFSSYAAMGGYQSNGPEKPDVEVEDDNKSEVIDNLKSVLTNDGKEEEDPDSLANRLQSAAIIKEKQDAEMKAKRDLERKAEKERIAEAQRQAAEEIRRREDEKIQKAKEEEERLIRAEQEKKEAEEQRQQAILAAQEEYWAKQLQKQGNIGTVMSDEDKEKNLEQVTNAIARNTAINNIRADQIDETKILQEVSPY